MGWLTTFLGPQAAFPPPFWDDYWYEKAEAGSSPYVIDQDLSMHVSAFFNGVRLLCETLAQPRLLLYERTGDDQKERATDARLYTVLHDQPNTFQTSYEYRVQQMQGCILWGNAYAEIVGGRRGAVDELWPLLPAHMKVLKLPSRRLGYSYRREDGIEVLYTQDEIHHIRGFPLSWDGVTGLSVLGFARQTLGLALNTQMYGTKLFENGAMHKGVFTVPGPLNKEQRDALRAELKRVHAGQQGWHSTLILEAGAKWENVSMSADDAQFLTTRKFEIAEVARWLNIPPHLLKDLERSTNNNIEHQGLEFLSITMLPWFVNWEQSIQRDLIVQKNRFFVEFLIDSIVRADIRSRYQAYATGINAGFLNRNEVRLKENLNHAEGLDKFLVDQNKALIDEGGEAKPISKPAGTPAGRPRPTPGQQLPPPRPNPDGEAHYRKLLKGNGDRIMRKEAQELVKALSNHKDEKLVEWADKFYAKHANFVAEVMQMHPNYAQKFVNESKDRFLLSVKDNSVAGLIKEMEASGGTKLVEFYEQEKRIADGSA